VSYRFADTDLQTEKQRIIWAYKILFLDVLFPLSLRKVIFMDSDQIIRADVAELWHMDIEVCTNPGCFWPLTFIVEGERSGGFLSSTPALPDMLD